MYCLDYPEISHPVNPSSSMPHELVFSGYHSQFASYSHSFKSLQPYIAAMVQMHFDGVFYSIGAS